MTEKKAALENPWLRVPVYAILLFEGAALVARSFLDVQMRNHGMNPGLATDLSYLVVLPLFLLLMYPVLKNHGRLLLPLLDPRVLSIRIAAIGTGLGTLTYLAYLSANTARSAMAISTEHGPVLPASLTTTWGCQDLSYLSLGIGVAVCLIPVIEEAINRGFLLHYFLPNGKFIAILLSTLLFAVFHPPGAILPAAVIGTYLAVITLKTGSLLPATIGHCTHNFLVQLDVHCIAMDWVETSTTTGIARSADVAVGVTITLLIIAGTLVSSKVTGARPARP